MDLKQAIRTLVYKWCTYIPITLFNFITNKKKGGLFLYETVSKSSGFRSRQICNKLYIINGDKPHAVKIAACRPHTTALQHYRTWRSPKKQLKLIYYKKSSPSPENGGSRLSASRKYLPPECSHLINWEQFQILHHYTHRKNQAFLHERPFAHKSRG